MTTSYRETNVAPTTTDETVDQGLIPSIHVLFNDLLPVVGISHRQSIFEEIDICSLIALVAQEIPPVVLNNLGRRIFPWLKGLGFVFVYLVKLLRLSSK